MPLSQQLSEYIAACFTGIWVESHEHEDALAEIAQLCRDQDWRLAVWDIAQGLQLPGQNGDADPAATDPLAAISAINALASPDSSAILVLQNFHKFLGSPEIFQTLAQQITKGKQNRTFVIVLSPVVQIPTELEKHFVVLQHDLPGREQLEEIARGIATEDGELPEGDGLGRVLDAAVGLTRFEAEYKGRLYQPLFDVVKDRGDDAYGDLLDALPLAGRDLVQKSLDREFGNCRQFEQTVGGVCQDCPQLAELILHGENYVAMSLLDAARDYFAIDSDNLCETV